QPCISKRYCCLAWYEASTLSPLPVGREDLVTSAVLLARVPSMPPAPEGRPSDFPGGVRGRKRSAAAACACYSSVVETTREERDERPKIHDADTGDDDRGSEARGRRNPVRPTRQWPPGSLQCPSAKPRALRSRPASGRLRAVRDLHSPATERDGDHHGRSQVDRPVRVLRASPARPRSRIEPGHRGCHRGEPTPR